MRPTTRACLIFVQLLTFWGPVSFGHDQCAELFNFQGQPNSTQSLKVSRLTLNKALIKEIRAEQRESDLSNADSHEPSLKEIFPVSLPGDPQNLVGHYFDSTMIISTWHQELIGLSDKMSGTLYEISIPIRNSVIKLSIPDTYPKEEFLNAVVSLIRQLPISHIEAIHEVLLEPVPWGEAVMSADRNGRIKIYPPFLKLGPAFLENQIDTFRHEFGHLIAVQEFGTQMPPAAYAAAKTFDKAKVSSYGQTNLMEDFAEAVMFYLKSNAGALDPELRKKLSHRFRFIDEIFKYDQHLLFLNESAQ